MVKFIFIGHWSEYAKYYHNNGYFGDKYYIYYSSEPYDRFSGFKLFLYRIHNSRKIAKNIQLPFKRVWANELIDNNAKEIAQNGANVCFILSATAIDYLENGIVEFLRKKYPFCSVALSFPDKVDLYMKHYKRFSISKCLDLFNFVYTYNINDSIKYNILKSPYYLHYVKETTPYSLCKYDVCFVGNDKGRLNEILAIYEKCKSFGLKTFFLICGVQERFQKFNNEIIYNHFLSYYDVIKIVNESKCILNILQPESSGITLRDYEAIERNKLLMTYNKTLFDSELFTPSKVVNINNLENEIYKINDVNCYKAAWNNVEKYKQDVLFDWLTIKMCERK